MLILFKYTRNLAFDEKPRYVYFKTVMRQKMEQLGAIDDKIYDWMLVDEPEPLEDVDLKFEVIPNEALFMKQISEELRLREKVEAEKSKTKANTLVHSASSSNLKAPKGKDKDCLIY